MGRPRNPLSFPKSERLLLAQGDTTIVGGKSGDIASETWVPTLVLLLSFSHTGELAWLI